jgi:hypothetical protein
MVGVRELGPGPPDAAYTPEVFRESLTEWIAIRNLPFSEVDSPSFRKVVRVLKSDAKVPSSDTIRRDVDKRFCSEKERMRAMLQDAPGRLSFGVDAWTSPNMQAFLGITVHWIDADWQIRNMLLALVPLAGRHTGENLCGAFTAVCRDFGVMTKLLAITTDNASNNDTFLAHLEAVCLREGISFDRDSMHVRCMAHVINLAVQDFLNKLNFRVMDSEDAYDADAGSKGFIQRLRKLIVRLRDSPQRREKLAGQCKAAGIRPKELVVDVRTRWNSTHRMIERALELREPLDTMALFNTDLFKDKPTSGEWKALKDIYKFLRVFDAVTNYMCATSHPTLAAAVPMYNEMMDNLERHRNAYPGPDEVKVAADVAMDKLKFYYSKTGAEVYPIATILDPRFKLSYYYDHGRKQKWIQDAHTAFGRAFARYRVSSAPDVREETSIKWDDDEEEALDGDPVMRLFKRRRIVEDDELERYLTAPPAAPKTDVLQWWKESDTVYPCLAAMARDYLAIPATSAPVERVFSGGTDIVQPKRRSMNGGTIGTSLSLKSWLKQPPMKSMVALHIAN